MPATACAIATQVRRARLRPGSSRPRWSPRRGRSAAAWSARRSRPTRADDRRRSAAAPERRPSACAPGSSASRLAESALHERRDPSRVRFDGLRCRGVRPAIRTVGLDACVPDPGGGIRPPLHPANFTRQLRSVSTSDVASTSAPQTTCRLLIQTSRRRQDGRARRASPAPPPARRAAPPADDQRAGRARWWNQTCADVARIDSVTTSAPTRWAKWTAIFGSQ